MEKSIYCWTLHKIIAPSVQNLRKFVNNIRRIYLRVSDVVAAVIIY